MWIYRSSHFRRWTPKLPPASVLVDISDTGDIIITDHDTDCSSDLKSFLGLIAEGGRWHPGGDPPAGPTVDLVVEIHGDHACWKCGNTASTFEIAGARLCCIDYPVGHPRMWSQCDLLHRAQERGSIPGPPDAYRIEYRSSKTTGSKYWAHVCPSCEAVQGDWYMLDDLLDRRLEQEYKPPLVRLTCTPETALQALDDLQTPPHWCRARRDKSVAATLLVSRNAPRPQEAPADTHLEHVIECARRLLPSCLTADSAEQGCDRYLAARTRPLSARARLMAWELEHVAIAFDVIAEEGVAGGGHPKPAHHARQLLRVVCGGEHKSGKQFLSRGPLPDVT